MQCSNNLRQIGIALHGYHNKYGSFPPAYVTDSSGWPMHSWRVLILPFLDDAKADEIYSQYDFDEPWDGPNNRKLHDEAISTYHCPSEDRKGPLTETNYLAVVGPMTAWPGETTTKLPYRDGESNTILLVESSNSGIHWMEPRDLHVTQMNLTMNAPTGQGISSRHRHGPPVLFADCSVKYLYRDPPQKWLRAWLTPESADRFSTSLHRTTMCRR